MLKNPKNLTCIDLILSDTPRSFQSTYVIETELSDFHLMTSAAMKKSFREFHPNLSIIGSTKTSQMKSLRKVY